MSNETEFFIPVTTSPIAAPGRSDEKPCAIVAGESCPSTSMPTPAAIASRAASFSSTTC